MRRRLDATVAKNPQFVRKNPLFDTVCLGRVGGGGEGSEVMPEMVKREENWCNGVRKKIQGGRICVLGVYRGNFLKLFQKLSKIW